MVCLKCKKPFVGTQRRKFCSDSCRVGFFLIGKRHEEKQVNKEEVSLIGEGDARILGSSDKGKKNSPDWAKPIKFFEWKKEKESHENKPIVSWDDEKIYGEAEQSH